MLYAQHYSVSTKSLSILIKSLNVLASPVHMVMFWIPLAGKGDVISATSPFGKGDLKKMRFQTKHISVDS